MAKRKFEDGARVRVIAGAYAGRYGTVIDMDEEYYVGLDEISCGHYHARACARWFMTRDLEREEAERDER